MTRHRESDTADFPHLHEFARGYLHQDLIPEYGSSAAAAKAYVADLKPADRQQLAAEATRFRDMIANFKIDDVNAAFGNLGAATRFKSADEVLRVLEALI